MKKEILYAQLAAAPKVEETAPRTRDLVFYSGASVERFDYMRWEIYTLRFSLDPKDVKLDRLNGKAPLLNSHQSYDLSSQIGVVERAWLDGSAAKATVRFSTDPAVDRIWNDVQDGIICNISMGVNCGDLEDVTLKGAKQKTYLARGWEPQEISVVPVGADPGAAFLSAIPTRQEFEAFQQHLAKTGAASIPPKQPFNRLHLAMLINQNSIDLQRS